LEEGVQCYSALYAQRAAETDVKALIGFLHPVNPGFSTVAEGDFRDEPDAAVLSAINQAER